jgi:hypothetical protein
MMRTLFVEDPDSAADRPASTPADEPDPAVGV